MDQLDWVQMKAEYMLSPVMSVMDFLRDKTRTNGVLKRNGFIARKTLGWKKEKLELQSCSADEAVHAVMKRRSMQLAIALGALNDLLVKRVLDTQYMQDRTPQELKLYIQMLSDMTDVRKIRDIQRLHNPFLPVNNLRSIRDSMVKDAKKYLEDNADDFKD